MKRYFYIICAMLVGVFVSCSKSDLDGNAGSPTGIVTLKVTADADVTTRTTSANRFAIEVYTDDTYETAANVFEDGTTHKVVNATGEFTMLLDCTMKYYCLLWADKDGAGIYNVTDLKAVTLTGKAVEAWQGTAEIDATTVTALTATINRAVSKITFKETGKLQVGVLKLNFNQPNMFNVATGMASGSETRPEESVTIATAVDGTDAPVSLNTADIFVLSSVVIADLTELTFQFNSKAAFTVPQVPLKANNNTNIKGHYASDKNVTFTVTYDDTWEASDNEETFPKAKVGDYYYDNNTFSSIIQPGKTCIGIVFWVDPTDATKGKIVSLDEPDANWNGLENEIGCLQWFPTYGLWPETYAIDKYNGMTNMATIKALDANYVNYPAFAWCAAKNAGSRTWYFPAYYEVRQLCAAISGQRWVESGADTSAGEINEWGLGYDVRMPNFDEVQSHTSRAEFNAKLTSVGGTALELRKGYWSSTEYNQGSAYFNESFWLGTSNGAIKNAKYRVRAISVF